MYVPRARLEPSGAEGPDANVNLSE